MTSVTIKDQHGETTVASVDDHISIDDLMQLVVQAILGRGYAAKSVNELLGDDVCGVGDKGE